MSAISAAPPSFVSNDDVDRAGRRAAWVAPRIRRLKAGEAELNPVIFNDSEGTVS
jgi:hypothetical protein